MNSHHPSDAYLIPTTLTPQFPAGFQLVDTIYPDGHSQKFSFSPDKPLDVYSGTVTVKLKAPSQSQRPAGPNFDPNDAELSGLQRFDLPAAGKTASGSENCGGISRRQRRRLAM